MADDFDFVPGSRKGPLIVGTVPLSLERRRGTELGIDAYEDADRVELFAIRPAWRLALNRAEARVVMMHLRTAVSKGPGSEGAGPLGIARTIVSEGPMQQPGILKAGMGTLRIAIQGVEVVPQVCEGCKDTLDGGCVHYWRRRAERG